MIEAPIFHVNGDDPEAVVYAAKVATEFRMKFHKPVVVDMFCYRRFGHNEGDEPGFTQPKMYKEFEAGQSYKPNKADWLDGQWSGLRSADNADEQRRGKTAVPMKSLKEIGRKLSTVPDNFNVHRTIKRFMENRAQMIETGEGIDWAMAEALAFGSLVTEGTRSACPVRTANAAPSRSVTRFSTIRTPKSVTSRSPTWPRTRPATKSSTRCFRKKRFSVSNMVIAGPSECADALGSPVRRLRQWCADVRRRQHAGCQLHDPANYFHILRRQMKRDFRKPLILMTPKSLLRHKRATSTLAEMAGESSFHRLLWDDAEVIKDGPIKLQKDAKIRRVVMCTGKVYYDLLEEREKRGIDDIYLLRIEQLYPFPAKR
ncbi:hypothetical protein Lal_00045138 [Lupinus albus]|nr:hypothetical protein Lal_00045138 [Lupinus albus]